MQEKLYRQAREALHNAQKEQAAYERMASEYTDHLIHSRRIEASFSQLRRVCDEQQSLLEAEKAACGSVDTLTSRVEEIVQFGIQECDAHCRRLVSEEGYRKRRLLNGAVDNAVAWYRANGDIESVLRERQRTLDARISSSWQLSYLLEGQKKENKRALEAQEARRRLFSSCFEELSSLLVECGIPVPTLSRLDKDPKVIAFRQLLADADTQMSVHKKATLAIESGQPAPLQLPLISSPRGLLHTPQPPPREAHQIAVD